MNVYLLIVKDADGMDSYSVFANKTSAQSELQYLVRYEGLNINHIHLVEMELLN